MNNYKVRGYTAARSIDCDNSQIFSTDSHSPINSNDSSNNLHQNFNLGGTNLQNCHSKDTTSPETITKDLAENKEFSKKSESEIENHLDSSVNTRNDVPFDHPLISNATDEFKETFYFYLK